MRRLFIPQKENRFHAVAIRQGALAAYTVFLIVFNIIIAPRFGLGQQAFASSISSARLVELANQSRQEAGAGTLSIDNRLVAAAEAKARDMFEDQYWAHYAPDGASPWDFIIASGYDYVYAGENLAKDFITSDAVHDAWMNSPSHRDNILNSRYRDIGIAVVDGVLDGSRTTLVVQMFGAESSSAPEEPEQTPKKDEDNQTENGPSAPEITSPENGDILNTGAFTVRGTSEAGTLVHVYDNDSKRADVTANEGIFSVELAEQQEGGHDLFADAEYTSGNYAGILGERSTTVSITLDFTPPEIDDSTYSILHQDSKLRIEFNASADTKTATAELEGITAELIKTGTTEIAHFEGEFEIIKSIETYTGKTVTLTLIDEATNTATIKKIVPSADVLAGYAAKRGGSIISDLSAYITSLSTQQKVNIGVAVFLIILFAIDGMVLWKMGIFRDKTNTTSHIAILSLAIIIGLFGGIGSIV